MSTGSKIVSRLAIQSWCFREFKHAPQLITALRECGVNHLEICGVHIDINNPAPTLKAYKDGGITISAFGVHGFGADVALARPAFEFARLAGFATLSADFADDAGLAVAEKLAEEYNKKLALHNHGRHHRLGAPWAIENLLQKSSNRVGLCLDTAWMLDSGFDPLEIAKKHQKRLYGLHLKDFIFNRAGKPEDVVVGTGNLNLKGLADFLKSIDFDGYVTLEYEGDAQNPVPALKQCVECIHAAFAD